MIPPPLKPQWFHILLALSRAQRHGYGIQRAVLEQTAGDIRLWPAMLYRSLATLETEGLVARIGTPADAPDDERRQYYAITPKGRRALRAAGKRLAEWAAAARSVEP